MDTEQPTAQDRMERRFRTGGLAYILVALLSAAYAFHLHTSPGGTQPPAYGLAVNYILDWSARAMDHAGGIFGGGWEPRAFKANLIIAGVIFALGCFAWLSSFVHRWFAFLGVLPQLLSRVFYMAGMALYSLDTLMALGLEIGVRRLYNQDGFALQCLVIHMGVLVILAYGFSTGLFGLWLGFQEFINFLRAPRATWRKLREQRARAQAPASND